LQKKVIKIKNLPRHLGVRAATSRDLSKRRHTEWQIYKIGGDQTSTHLADETRRSPEL
ncbi:hypothetical protein Ancab_029472, partial [Ancistrocladus abbreviatus]